MSALDPIIHERHARALNAQLAALRREPDVIAAHLQGSVTRGDAHPGSDLDFLVVLADDRPSAFRHALVDGVRVEQHRVSVPTLRAKLHRRPGLACGLVEARCLFDRAGVVPALRDHAQRVLASYAPDARERARLAYWLWTAAEKVEAAREGADWLRASLIPRRRCGR
ncbi:MAG TPA: nucleotidyltransferase domain-containing protein [Chloroflexota bacterium]|nr:nucleotidyltransferase domain-containing protein [Chloroflexota bacterium]